MKNKINSKIILSVLALVLVAAMALGFAACGNNTDENETTGAPTTTEAAKTEDVTEIGNGQKTIAFEVKDKDGNVTKFSVKTDAETVGAALVENKLVSGTSSEYGLMVDTVNGIKYDYNADKMYWGFLINGEMSMTGVDSTPIDETATYSFVATAA